MTPANPFSLSAYGRRLLVLAGVVALALGAVWLASWWDGRNRDHASETAGAVTVVQQERAAAETVYTTDTVRLWRTVTRVEASRDTVLAHLTDTVRVKQYVAACDSLARSCRETVATAENRVRLADSLAALYKTQRDLAAYRPHLTKSLQLLYAPQDMARDSTWLRLPPLIARADAELRIRERWSAKAEAERPLANGSGARYRAGLKWTF